MSDLLGITSSAYQKWAAHCIGNFLATQESHANIRNIQQADGSIPIQVRVNETPPSVQIMKLPLGGIGSGLQRIREKLAFKYMTPSPYSPHILLPCRQSPIVVAQEEDLTRECLIVTLRDIALETLLKQSLLSPKEVAMLISSLRDSQPNFFVACQRYLLGIEHGDGITVAYNIVTAEDRETIEYLEKLASSFT